MDFTCDLTNAAAFAGLVRAVQPSALFHMAGVTVGADWDLLWQANVVSTLNVMEGVAAHAPSCRVIIPGSAAEYGELNAREGPAPETHELRPSSPYGVSKASQTLLARSFVPNGADVVVGRIFNLCGEGVPPSLVLGSVADQLRRIIDGELPARVRLGDLTAIRDFLDVDDVCAALLQLVISGRTGEVYNVCSGEPRVVEDAVRMLIDASGLSVALESSAGPAPAVEVSWSVGSNEKLRAETNWSPRRGFTESLERMLT